MATQERDSRPYELMTVFIPDLSEEDNQAQIERTEGYISSAGGSLTQTLTNSPWGRRRLAYTIRFNGVDYRDGFYTVFHFDSRPSLLVELERDLKLDTNVMRYLLVHDDPKAGEKFPEEDAAEGDGETDGEVAAGAQAAAGTAAPATEVEAAAETSGESTDESTAETGGGDAEEAPAESGDKDTDEAPAGTGGDEAEQAPAESGDEAPVETADEAPAQDVDAAAEVAPETTDDAPSGDASDEDTSDKE